MYRLIGAASGWGAQIRECEEGPEVLRTRHLLDDLRENNIPISTWEMIHPAKKAKDNLISLSACLPLIHDFTVHLADAVEKTLSSHEFPVVLGGDHSIALGTWNGAYQFFQKKNSLPLGLIWIDAHMDAHTLETTPSGAWHGMPLAGLLGYGVPLLAKLKESNPVLLPENLCLIGTRSFEEGEARLLKRLNVRIFMANEVKERGIESVLKEAIDHVRRRTKVFGVSLDLDVVDPQEAPGVGSPEPGGLNAKDLMKALLLLKNQEQFKAFELVEYNPKRDLHGKTAILCQEILKAVLKTAQDPEKQSLNSEFVDSLPVHDKICKHS